MTPEEFSLLEIARFELRLRALEPLTLPLFLGSTLRGAFGHALKSAVCVMEHRNCERCMLSGRCIYPYLFETPAPPEVPQLRGQKEAPHPFILSPPLLETRAPAYHEPPSTAPMLVHNPPIRAAVRLHSPITFQPPARRSLEAGDELTFGLLLIGRAIDYLPYLVFAVREMAWRGLGANRGRFELVEVSAVGQDGVKRRIYSGGSGRLNVPSSPASSLGDIIRARLERLSKAVGIGSTANGNGRSDKDSAFCDSARDDFARGDSARGTSSNHSSLNHSQPGDSARGDSFWCEPADDDCAVITGVKNLRQLSRLKLRFLTPTRIRIEGDLQVGMSFDLLVRNLLRRVSMLAAVHGRRRLELDYRGLIAQATEVETVTSSLRWFDWERYSNRQQTKMKMGGFVGDVEYESEILSEFLPLITAGEILHVGSATSFGLGRYEIEGIG